MTIWGAACLWVWQVGSSTPIEEIHFHAFVSILFGTLAMFRNVQKRPETVMEGLDTDTLCQNFTTLAAKLQQ